MMLKMISLETIEQFEKHLISDEKSKATIKKYIREHGNTPCRRTG